MLKRNLWTTALAAGLLSTSPASLQWVQAQPGGVLREGVQRAGRAVTEGARRVGQGAQRVVEGTARATGNVARGATGVVRGTADTLTGGRTADWRMRQYNDRWWYYTPQGNWMVRQDDAWSEYSEIQGGNLQPPQIDPQEMQQAARQQQQFSGQYESGYRGSDASPSSRGAQQLHFDRCGRPYICLNGRRCYVSMTSSTESTQPQHYSAQYGTRTPGFAAEEMSQPSLAEPAVAGRQGGPSSGASDGSDGDWGVGSLNLDGADSTDMPGKADVSTGPDIGVKRNTN